jgi:hypothetical protein
MCWLCELQGAYQPKKWAIQGSNGPSLKLPKPLTITVFREDRDHPGACCLVEVRCAAAGEHCAVAEAQTWARSAPALGRSNAV